MHLGDGSPFTQKAGPCFFTVEQSSKSSKKGSVPLSHVPLSTVRASQTSTKDTFVQISQSKS